MNYSDNTKSGPLKGSIDEEILAQNGPFLRGWYSFIVHPEMQDGSATHCSSFGGLYLPRHTTTTSTRVQSITRTLCPHVSGCETMDIYRIYIYIYMSLQSGTEYSCTQKGAAQNWDNNERTHGVRDASQAAGTYADRLETLANVREAGISVSR